jgi:hypothetical protein
MGGFMEEFWAVFGIFAIFITLGISLGAMSAIAVAVVSLVGLGTILTLWFKQET